MDPKTQLFTVSRDVIFDETPLYYEGVVRNKVMEEEVINLPTTSTPSSSSDDPSERGIPYTEADHELQEETTHKYHKGLEEIP